MLQTTGEARRWRTLRQPPCAAERRTANGQREASRARGALNPLGFRQPMATATDTRSSSNGARPKLTPRARVEVCPGKIMAALPPRAQIRLSGKPPIKLDGQTLEPDIQLLLAMIERQGNPPIETVPPPKARAAVLHQSQAFAGPEIGVKEVRNIEVDGAEGPIKARHYVP